MASLPRRDKNRKRRLTALGGFIPTAGEEVDQTDFSEVTEVEEVEEMKEES
jgi:hypothetical protein